MGYTEYTPAPALRDWVKCFWSIKDAPSDAVQEVWPDGCVELCFQLGNIFRIADDGTEERFPKVFVLGLQTKIVRVRAEGTVRLFAARLLPFGIRDWKQQELLPLAGRIEPHLRSGRFQAAVPVLEQWLLAQPKLEDELVIALRRLYSEAGNISVGELSSAQGVSSRQLQRMFAGKLGLSPKAVAKVVRFAESWSRLLSKPDLSLAELALDLGYSDQPHFTHEFTSFGKRSPSAFQKEQKKK